MRLAIQAGSVADRTLEGCIAFCRAMGVENVVLTAPTVPGFQETGVLDAKALKAQIAAVEGAGLKTGALQYRPPFSVASQAAAADTLDKLTRNMDALAEAGLDTLTMFLGVLRPVSPADEEPLWGAYLALYGEMIARAEERGIKIAAHYCGHRGRTVPAGSEAYRRLFEAIPSPSNGLCFCVGNAWNSEGGRIYNVLREFAPRIYTVHMRGTRVIWGETPFWWDIPDGPDIRQIFQILGEVGYTGMISAEHMPDMPEPNGRDVGLAWAMGYMRAIVRYL